MPGATGLEVLERLEYEPQRDLHHRARSIRGDGVRARGTRLRPQAVRTGSARARHHPRQEHLARRAASASSIARRRRCSRRGGCCRRSSSATRTGFCRWRSRQIERVQAADDYVTIFTPAKEYLVSVRLSDLERHLGADRFLRIHRSHLVNLEYVTSIQRVRCRPSRGGDEERRPNHGQPHGLETPARAGAVAVSLERLAADRLWSLREQGSSWRQSRLRRARRLRQRTPAVRSRSRRTTATAARVSRQTRGRPRGRSRRPRAVRRRDTIQRTVPAGAPSAMRMPISRGRRLTE